MVHVNVKKFNSLSVRKYMLTMYNVSLIAFILRNCYLQVQYRSKRLHEQKYELNF